MAVDRRDLSLTDQKAANSSLLEPREAVAYLRTNRNRLIEWTRTGQLPVVRLGERRILYRRCDLDAFIASRVTRGG